MKFSSALLCSLSILLGDQSPTGPTHVTARVSLISDDLHYENAPKGTWAALFVRDQ